MMEPSFGPITLGARRHYGKLVILAELLVGPWHDDSTRSGRDD